MFYYIIPYIVLYIIIMYIIQLMRVYVTGSRLNSKRGGIIISLKNKTNNRSGIKKERRGWEDKEGSCWSGGTNWNFKFCNGDKFNESNIAREEVWKKGKDRK